MHPFAVGVIFIVELIGEFEVLVAVNAEMFPFPDAASPIEVLLLVHE